MRQLALFSLFFCACLVNAQMPTAQPAIGQDPISIASRQMEIFNRAVQNRKDDEVRRTAANRQEQLARAEFWQKANQFVTLWGDFAKRLNEKQTFDAKLAKKVSKAFHELEKSDGWPVR